MLLLGLGFHCSGNAVSRVSNAQADAAPKIADALEDLVVRLGDPTDVLDETGMTSRLAGHRLKRHGGDHPEERHLVRRRRVRGDKTSKVRRSAAKAGFSRSDNDAARRQANQMTAERADPGEGRRRQRVAAHQRDQEVGHREHFRIDIAAQAIVDQAVVQNGARGRKASDPFERHVAVGVLAHGAKSQSGEQNDPRVEGGIGQLARRWAALEHARRRCRARAKARRRCG